ncbi:hypothetical protein VTK26DRAFT_8873 [Humicola hyalothermophila]
MRGIVDIWQRPGGRTEPRSGGVGCFRRASSERRRAACSTAVCIIWRRAAILALSLRGVGGGEVDLIPT